VGDGAGDGVGAGVGVGDGVFATVGRIFDGTGCGADVCTTVGADVCTGGVCIVVDT